MVVVKKIIKKASKYKLFICLSILVLIVIFAYLYISSDNLFPSRVDTISIKDGNTGLIYHFNKSDAQEFLDKISSSNVRASGIKGWTSGYTYKIKFIANNGSETNFVVYGANNLTKGFVKYNIDKDIVKVIQDYCND